MPSKTSTTGPIAADTVAGSDRSAAGGSRRTFDSLEQEVYLNLWRTYDRLKSLEEELFGRYELSAQQYNALRLLRAAHPGSMQTLELAGRLISRAPDITRLLDKLAQRGLLLRERSEANRRVVEARITRAGLKLLAQLDEPVRACHRRQLGHLSEKPLRELASLLERARAPHEDSNSPSLVDE